MARKLHRFLHAPKSDMRKLLADAAVYDERITTAYDKFYDACDVCASSCRLRMKRKISITHVNQTFNQGLQIDLTVGYLKGDKFELKY